MRVSFRPSVLLLVTYLLLSLTPFIGLLAGQAVPRAGLIALVELIGWLIVWSLFKRPAYFHWLLLPAFLAMPVEIYLRVFLGQSISTNHLGIIAETSPLEAAEFLGDKAWWLGAVALGLVLGWALTLRLALRTRSLDWCGWSRWGVAGASLLLAISYALWLSGDTTLAGAIAAVPGRQVQAVESAARVKSASGIDSPTLAIDTTMLASTWPFGIFWHGYNFWKERAYLGSLAHASEKFSFGASQVQGTPGPQVVVLVIGESSRYDRWSLNGYLRDTTPLLRTEPNVVSLSNLVTAVSATRLSVPILVSRKPAIDSLQASFREKSFITAYKEAGFKTFWLSNQMSFGQYDTPVSVYANEADVSLFLNVGGLSKASDLDAVLLAPLRNALADRAQKKLIVLHTLGSHWNYSHRYPQSFDKWQPSLFGVEQPAITDLKIKPQLNNSYDNTILYTDWILGQVLAALKHTDAVTSMMYVADHGQTLYDGNCRLAFHGHNTQFEFHVPALVWYSDAYRLAYPHKVERLIRNRHARLATENIFHSLLDMADLHYPTERLTYSFLSRTFKQHKRYVDSYGWTDYDNATFKGDCREVIDNCTPLVQKH